MKKKAISPLISIILVVLISFILIIAYNFWLKETITEATTRADAGIEGNFDCRNFKVFVDSCVVDKNSETNFVNNISIMLDNRSTINIKDLDVSVFGYYQSDDYIIEAFTEVGEHTWNVPEGVREVEVLVVAGGGGGGRGSGGNAGGSGGGAGGLIFEENYKVTPGNNINIFVGKGGDGLPPGDNTDLIGDPGDNSIFGSIVTYGGGGGASYNTTNKNVLMNGGSGAGGHVRTTPYSTSYGFGTVDQGNDGGQIISGSGDFGGGLGGGGAGEKGEDGIAYSSNGVRPGSNGGDGLYFGNIFGNEYGDNGWFAGGGGGGGASDHASLNIGGSGGIGGGGDGGSWSGIIISSSGINNTGGGGGGGNARGSLNNGGGDGGSGIVLIRYRVSFDNSLYGNLTKTLNTGKNSYNFKENYNHKDGELLSDFYKVSKIIISNNACPDKIITINDCKLKEYLSFRKNNENNYKITNFFSKPKTFIGYEIIKDLDETYDLLNNEIIFKTPIKLSPEESYLLPLLCVPDGDFKIELITQEERFSFNLNENSSNDWCKTSLIGQGTEQNPYKIYNPFQYNKIRDNLDSYFKLKKNIDFTINIDFTEYDGFENYYNEGWQPILNFTGVLDSQGNNINPTKNYIVLKDCKSIKNIFSNSQNGLYYLDLNYYQNPLLLYCDMTNRGGGWTLVTNIIDTVKNNIPTTVEEVRQGWTEISDGVLVDFNGGLSYNLGYFIGVSNLDLLNPENIKLCAINTKENKRCHSEIIEESHYTFTGDVGVLSNNNFIKMAAALSGTVEYGDTINSENGRFINADLYLFKGDTYSGGGWATQWNGDSANWHIWGYGITQTNSVTNNQEIYNEGLSDSGTLRTFTNGWEVWLR